MEKFDDNFHKHKKGNFIDIITKFIFVIFILSIPLSIIEGEELLIASFSLFVIWVLLGFVIKLFKK